MSAGQGAELEVSPQFGMTRIKVRALPPRTSIASRLSFGPTLFMSYDIVMRDEFIRFSLRFPCTNFIQARQPNGR
jgi:hypothetical protein